jgi:hypothetical protein
MAGEKVAVELPEVCPKCGTETIFGYGLNGGGVGTYVMCGEDGCDFFAKRLDREGEE